MEAARILVAEDEAAVARPLVAALTERGHQVRWVRAVRELRAELPVFSPAVLLLDVTLDTDGLEFLQAIRFAPHCPPAGVVVLTDPGDTGARDRAHQLGAAAVVTKAPTPDRVVEVVEDLIAFL
ncbi:MAG: response regulator [Candidatus Dormiibacterota bacterium]